MLTKNIHATSSPINLIDSIAAISINDLIALQKYLQNISDTIFDSTKTIKEAIDILMQLDEKQFNLNQILNEEQTENMSDKEKKQQQNGVLDFLNSIINQKKINNIINKCPYPIQNLLKKITTEANNINSSGKEIEGAQWATAWLNYFLPLSNVNNAKLTRVLAIILVIHDLFMNKSIPTILNSYLLEGLFNARQAGYCTLSTSLTDKEQQELDDKYLQEIIYVQHSIEQRMKDHQQKDTEGNIITHQKNIPHTPLQSILTAACIGGLGGATCGLAVSGFFAPFTGGLSLFGILIIPSILYVIGFITVGLATGLTIAINQYKSNKKNKALFDDPHINSSQTQQTVISKRTRSQSMPIPKTQMRLDNNSPKGSHGFQGVLFSSKPINNFNNNPDQGTPCDALNPTYAETYCCGNSL